MSEPYTPPSPGSAPQESAGSGAAQTTDPATATPPASISGVPEAAPGVPFFDLDNPFGGSGIGVLVGLDLEAKHEQNQPASSPATDQSEPISWVPSGGSAYYMDFTTGKGWSVPVNRGGS